LRLALAFTLRFALVLAFAFLLTAIVVPSF
jgi:hypothetical protein